MLPGLDRLKLPIPLGGTSNHFKTEALRQIGGWDPFNVTEDADLGIRAQQRATVSASSTPRPTKRPPAEVGNWIAAALSLDQGLHADQPGVSAQPFRPRARRRNQECARFRAPDRWHAADIPRHAADAGSCLRPGWPSACNLDAFYPRRSSSTSASSTSFVGNSFMVLDQHDSGSVAAEHYGLHAVCAVANPLYWMLHFLRLLQSPLAADYQALLLGEDEPRHHRQVLPSSEVDEPGDQDGGEDTPEQQDEIGRAA